MSRHRSQRLGSPLVSPEQLETRSLMAAQSLDGTGNNLAHPDWGSTAEDLLRRSPAAYADGASAPSGADRPNARAISNALAQSPEGGITNDRDLSAFVYAWGQFLDHDLSLTEAAVPRERFSIAVPAGDPSFDPAGTGAMTISMSRSAYDPTTGTAAGNPRQQTNSITAFIDGSQVYGSDAERAAALREFSGGRLKTSAGNLLPYNTAGLANANDAHLVADSALFLAGDVRANENPELIAVQTLFVREHNRIAAAAAALHAYRGYRADVNPGIATEFSTAAFRFGHSLLGDDIQFLDNAGNEVRAALSLRDAFFNAPVVSQTGIDPILKYLASDRAQEIDTKVVDDVRNFLFGAPGQGGFDLAALNIQRGRDHGLADYNTVRSAYGLPKVTSFAQITGDKSVQDSLVTTYGSVDRLDLWVAGLAEKHLPGSSLGETFTRIIVDQFRRLRDGDRYWYQNALPASAVREIQKTTLADIVRRNTQVTSLQGDVFFFRATVGGTVFADLNRDGRRQPREAGLAGTTVSLVTAAGATLATTTTDARGNYVFKGLDLGSYKVVVTPPAGGDAVTSRTVAIARGVEIRDNDVGLVPREATPQRRPTAPPAGAPARPSGPPRAAVFAALGAGNLRAGRRAW